MDKLPVMTMDVRVTSCNDSSQILMGGSGPTYWVDMGTGSRFYVSSPNNLFQAGNVDILGVRFPA
jgi:hypothetical protein